MTRALLGLALGIGCLAAPAAASAAEYHVDPSGSDSAAGNEANPWRTIQKAIDTLSPGDTVYLHPGTYGERGTVTTVDVSGSQSSKITFNSLPGAPRAEILGHVKITGSYVRFAHLVFDGPTGTVKPLTSDNPRGEQVQVAVEGTGVAIVRSIVRDSDWHAGIYLSGAENARMVGNCVTGNGDEQLSHIQWNTSHGIYWSSGSGVITNNLVADNLARGIQLYEQPHDVLIKHNTVVGNGRAGIQFANQTRDSKAVNNVVAFNGDTGIRGSELGSGDNVARNNLGYHNENGNFGIGFGEQGLSFSDNHTGPPAFVDPQQGDYRLRSESDAVDEARKRFSPAVDQERIRRPQGGAPDQGAYERVRSGGANAERVCR